MRAGAQQATKHHHADRWDRAELERDLQPVGDDGQFIPFALAQRTGDFDRGRTGVQDDRFAVLDQLGRGMADAPLLSMAMCFLEARWRVGCAWRHRYCTAVRAHDRRIARECLEVGTYRHRRDVEASRKFLDRCTTLPLDEFDDESAAFFDEQAGRG